MDYFITFYIAWSIYNQIHYYLRNYIAQTRGRRNRRVCIFFSLDAQCNNTPRAFQVHKYCARDIFTAQYLILPISSRVELCEYMYIYTSVLPHLLIWSKERRGLFHLRSKWWLRNTLRQLFFYFFFSQYATFIYSYRMQIIIAYLSLCRKDIYCLDS